MKKLQKFKVKNKLTGEILELEAQSQFILEKENKDIEILEQEFLFEDENNNIVKTKALSFESLSQFYRKNNKLKLLTQKKIDIYNLEKLKTKLIELRKSYLESTNQETIKHMERGTNFNAETKAKRNLAYEQIEQIEQINTIRELNEFNENF